jgi:hypothetical protein
VSSRSRKERSKYMTFTSSLAGAGNGLNDWHTVPNAAKRLRTRDKG